MLYKHWLVLTLALVMKMTLLAQGRSSSFNWKTFVGNQLNPGLSVGVGGGHMYHYMPSLKMKFFCFGIQGSEYNRHQSTDKYSLNRSLLLSVDMAELYMLEKPYRSYLTFAIAYNKHSTESNTHVQVSPLFGLSYYSINKRTSYVWRIGASRYISRTHAIQTPVAEVERYFPYAQFSFTYHMFRFRDIQPKMKGSELRLFIKTYCNPFISVGFGSDRGVYMPALGIRSANFHTQVSVYGDYGSSLVSFVAMYDPIELRSSVLYENRLGFGYNHYSRFSSDAFSSTTHNVHGILFERIANRKNKYWSFYVRLGAGLRISRTITYPGKSVSKAAMPLGGLGFQLHLFKHNGT